MALGKKKRDLDFEDELYELVARGAGMSKISRKAGEAALDIAHRKATGEANHRLTPAPHVPQGLADAAKKASQPHDSKIVA
jgi:hypothetical protein